MIRGGFSVIFYLPCPVLSIRREVKPQMKCQFRPNVITSPSKDLLFRDGGISILQTWFRESTMKKMAARMACIGCIAVMASTSGRGGEPPSHDEAWKIIAPFFRPPAEYTGKFGHYRSPLLFDDGKRVESAADWPRRRKEILDAWNALMGPWPPVIEKPKLEIVSETKRDEFTQRRVRVEIAPKQITEGWLLTPPGAGPFPAVLVVYYEPETSVGLNPKQPLRDFALQLTKRGFVTLSIGTPGGNAWKPDIGKALCQPLSYHAYVAANCWQALASRPEVDARGIGVTGHSYGGKWAMFAAALWDKFAAVAVSDPGIVFDEKRANVNYWEPWYLGLDPDHPRPKAGIPSDSNPRTGAYKKMVEAHRDLHELHALIAPRPFFVSGGSEDQPERWIALNHAVAVNQLLGQSDRVAMTNRKNHTPTEESNMELYAFFEHFLGAAAKK
jgi:dienelactone hydrolase